MPELPALVAFAAIVAVVGLLGIGLGMLLAPRLGRWMGGDEEEADPDEPAARDDEEVRGVDA